MRKVLPHFLRRPGFAACVVAGGLASLSASSAEAQIFNFLFGDGLRASEVERMLEMRGLRPVSPITRNGQVYIADVVLPGGRPQRLIIDAYDGQILEHFRPPRSYGEVASPRPPADIGADTVDRPPPAASSSSGPSVVTFGDSVARGDDSGGPVPHGAGDDADAKGKTKGPVKHKKIDLTPMAQPSSGAPANAKPAASEASTGAPPAADVKVAPAPAATPPSPAPAPKAAGGKPAINDVPVDPLD